MKSARDGAGSLLAYATLLAVVAAAATSETRPENEQQIIDACARAWLHSSVLLFLCAAGLRGYLPGGKPKKPQPFVARILLASVGLGFFGRAAHFAYRYDGEVAKVAVGTMIFLGILALALVAVTSIASAKVSDFLRRQTPREVYLQRRQPHHRPPDNKKKNDAIKQFLQHTKNKDD